MNWYKMYKIAKSIKLYRGESMYNKGGHYYTTDKEWAKQFTQSGLDSEIKMISVPENIIYRKDPLPSAVNEKEFDVALTEAKGKGFKAFWVDEGIGEPNSVYFI